MSYLDTDLRSFHVLFRYGSVVSMSYLDTDLPSFHVLFRYGSAEFPCLI